MANDLAREERKARKAYVHDRQVMVIRASIVFLVICAVLAGLGLTGFFSLTKDETVLDSSNNFGVTAPCPPANAVYPNVSQTTVRILNGTGKSGIATAVGQALQNRGFQIQTVSNSSEKLSHTEIRTGAQGLPQAYLVLAQFTDAALRLDDRTDQLVDVVIGSSFSYLQDEKAAQRTADTRIKGLSGCVAAGSIRSLPKAPAHTPVHANQNATRQTS